VEQPQDHQLPTIFALGQNYPNPFNPTTAIEFALPHKSNVKLTVYNLLGQEIVTLVNGELPAGNHTVLWNAHDTSGREVSSGIYFYRLTAGNFVATKKMICLR
jgi:flagellar hook assembly protein FlgD